MMTRRKGNIPTIDVGAVAYSEQESVAKVEVSPSTDTETWYWKCTPTSETGTWNSVTGNQPTTLDLDVELDKDYEFEAYAENAYGKSEVKTVPFRINSSELPGDMVTITVKHLTAFSVDVDIEKSVKCSRYVVAAMPKSAYNELYFISSAETSLNPNKDYPLQPYNWSDRSATFTEYTLSKNKMQDDPESEGVRLTADDQDGMNEMIVAVYAEPAGDGQAEVFTQEFTVPKPSNYNGSIEVDIDVKDDDITLSTFAATVAAGDACKKIFTSLIQLGGDGVCDLVERGVVELLDDRNTEAAGRTAVRPAVRLGILCAAGGEGQRHRAGKNEGQKLFHHVVFHFGFPPIYLILSGR